VKSTHGSANSKKRCGQEKAKGKKAAAVSHSLLLSSFSLNFLSFLLLGIEG